MRVVRTSLNHFLSTRKACKHDTAESINVLMETVNKILNVTSSIKMVNVRVYFPHCMRINKVNNIYLCPTNIRGYQVTRQSNAVVFTPKYLTATPTFVDSL